MTVAILKTRKLSTIITLLLTLVASGSAQPYHDLSEFACLDAEQAVQVVYYEVGPMKSLPTPSMQGSMELAYDGGCVSRINFPQSTSAFAGSGKTNNFIAYFEGQLQFPSAGKWTLYTASQDGSKLYIDGKQIVDNDGVHENMKEKSGTVEVTDNSLIKAFRLEYFKGDKGANNGLILKWKGPGKKKSTVQPTDFYTPSEFSIIGLPAYRFEIKNAATTRYPTESRNTLPSSYKPLMCATKPDYEYSWPNTDCTLTQNQAVVLVGYVQFPSKGTYTITEISDDDAKVYLDDKLVLSVDGTPGFRDKGQFSVPISEAGTIKYLRIEFLELCLGSGLELTWKGPGITEGTPIVFFVPLND